MLGVLAEGGLPEVQVAQTAIGGVAVVGIGSGQVAQHGHVVAVERTDDGQRVILGVVVALQIANLAVLLHGRQTQFAGQLTCFGGADAFHFPTVIVGIAHNILGILAPRRLVGFDTGGRHVDAQSVVLFEVSGASQLGGCLAAHDDGVQFSGEEGLRLYLCHRGGNLYLCQVVAVGKGIVSYALDGGGQHDVAQAAATVEPAAAHVVEAHALKLLKVGKRADVVVAGKLVVEPREAHAGDARQVDEVVPIAVVGAGGGGVVVAHVLQHTVHGLVGLAHDAGHEAVAIDVPCRVGLEPGHLLGQHLYLGGGAVKDALAGLHLLRRQGHELVRTVGLHIDEVDVHEVRAVGEAGVLQRDVEATVAVADAASPIEVGERHGAQHRVAVEGLALHVVQLVVVVGADVVAQFHGALVQLCEAVVVRGVHASDDGVLNQVAAHLVLLLDGVLLVCVGVACAVLAVLHLGLGGAVLEETGQRCPRLVV